MKPEGIEDIYGLSPLQQGIFFHALESPGAGLYFEQVTMPYDGPFNLPALKQAWQAALDRFAVLRSAFHWENLEKPLQVVHKQVDMQFDELDWRDVPAPQRQQRLEEFLLEDRMRGFDLEKPPLLRATIVRFDLLEHVLILSFHHLLLDGWSFFNVMKDVGTYYTAFAQNTRPVLPPARGYSEYIAWLRRQDLNKAEAYWRKRLANFAAPTPLGVDRLPRSELTPQVGFAEQEIELPRSISATLTNLAREHKVTPSTFIQAAWALLLSRYSGSKDVVFGTIVSGRPAELKGVEMMVGLFINTLPVRVEVEDDALLIPWLCQLQEQIRDLMSFQYSPLIEVQGWSDIPRGTPIFESILAFENYGGSEVAEMLEMFPKVRFSDRTNYPLTVLAAPAEKFLLKIQYQTHLFDGATIGRMLGHFKNLLNGFATNHRMRLRDYDILSRDERRQLLVGWAGPRTRYPRDKTVNQLVAEQARMHGDSTALVFEDRALSYAELDRNANQLAHYLRDLGVGENTMIAVYMERSLEMVVACLGVLKAGGAYVPINASYPAERIIFMLQDVDAPVVLTQASLRTSLPQTAAKVVDLEREWREIAQSPTHQPECDVKADDLAYVMYTSGSTGDPKGTCIPHRAIVRLVRDTNYLKVQAGDVFLQLAPISFDAATLEIWAPLLNGAQLAIFPPRTPTLDQLGEEILRRGVTHLWLTSGLFSQMVEHQLDKLANLRCLITGGDVVAPAAARRALQRLGPGKLINGYGPTENTTFTTSFAIDRESDLEPTIPIGTPIANTQVYVLDERMEPVPVGVPGLLYAAGDGLARGYLNRPERTEDRFVEHSFPDSGATGMIRLYRTGDHVRRLPDGNIEFLGRDDDQVKIRGYRIELGESTTVLNQHAGLREATVVVRGATPETKRLVAYFVPVNGAHPNSAELRRFMQSSLPNYMVPSTFVAMDCLPLTPNGKIDRHALPELDEPADPTGPSHVAPRTTCEEILATLWSEVFRREEIGVHDHFLDDLGGHSLTATQLVSRICNQFEIHLPLRAVFQYPTIAELALVVEDMLLEGEVADETEAEVERV